MNQDETQAEEFVKQGVSEALLAFAEKIKGEESWKSHLDEAITLYNKALSPKLIPQLGLEEKVSCLINLTELLLTKLFTYAYETEVARMLNTDLEDEKMVTVKEALRVSDEALKLDAQATTPNLKSDRSKQARILPELDALWRFHGRYLKDTSGNARKLAYLLERIGLIKYIDGLYLPGICLSLADCYYEDNNLDEALNWLQRCISAEDYSDLPGHRESLPYQLAQASVEDAHKKLRFLQKKQQGVSTSQQQERERLIAKRRAAGECEICGTKLGFFDKAGGNVRCKAHR